MPKISIYKKRINDQLARLAFELYKTGMTIREVGKDKKINRSHSWVLRAIKKLQK